ncbi:unannotated protein [freshwater metagenome]|uniref:Unannotated protein n=1 Tax=freshwater metagenome TaxID=449393 RepID=A0A6J7P7F9_9ZZZZ
MVGRNSTVGVGAICHGHRKRICQRDGYVVDRRDVLLMSGNVATPEYLQLALTLRYT